MTVTGRARAVAGAVVALAGLTLVVLATRSGQTRDIASHRTPYHPGSPLLPEQHGGAQHTGRPGHFVDHGSPGWVHVLILVVLGMLFAVAAGSVIAYLVQLIRRYERAPREPKRADEHGDWAQAPPDVATAIAEAVEKVLAEIERGETRDAIIACWLRLEEVAAQAGVARRPAETAEELTARVLAAHRVSRPTLERLAELYREARFSAHRMEETARDEARRALERIRAELVPA